MRVTPNIESLRSVHTAERRCFQKRIDLNALRDGIAGMSNGSEFLQSDFAGCFQQLIENPTCAPGHHFGGSLFSELALSITGNRRLLAFAMGRLLRGRDPINGGTAMISIARPSAALVLGSAIIMLAACTTVLPAPPPPPAAPVSSPAPTLSFSDCSDIPLGTYTGSSNGKSITLEVTQSPVPPGFKHNVSINSNPPSWNYVGICDPNAPNTMNVQRTIAPGTTVTKWTVTDAGSGNIHVTDMGSGGSDPSPGFNGTLAP